MHPICRWRAWWSRAHWPRLHQPCRPPRRETRLLFASHKQSSGLSVYGLTLQAAPARDAPTLRQSQTVLRTVCVRAQPHIRFLFIVPRFRLGLAYRTPPRGDALALWLTFGSTCLVPGLSPDWIRAMHGTHVKVSGLRGLSRRSARLPGWSPLAEAPLVAARTRTLYHRTHSGRSFAPSVRSRRTRSKGRESCLSQVST